MSETPKDEWRTPPEIFEWANRNFGPFDFDAACDHANALATPLWCAPGFEPFNSLSAPWPDGCRIWMNPPYSRGRMDPFLEAAMACKSFVVTLIMSPNGEDRFLKLAQASHEIHIVGRVGFVDQHGNPVYGNTRGSSIFLINPPYGEGQRTVRDREVIYGRKAA